MSWNFDVKRTRNIIRSWDSRPVGKGVSQELKTQIVEIADSWRAFSGGEANERQQQIAFEVHKYMLDAVTTNKRKRTELTKLKYFKVYREAESSGNTEAALKEYAFVHNANYESLRTKYYEWKQDPQKVQEGIRFYIQDYCHCLWEVLYSEL